MIKDNKQTEYMLPVDINTEKGRIQFMVDYLIDIIRDETCFPTTRSEIRAKVKDICLNNLETGFGMNMPQRTKLKIANQTMKDTLEDIYIMLGI